MIYYEKSFVLCAGSRPNAHRYVRQFTEIFTESGRKSVRISCGLVSAARNEAQGAARHSNAAPAPPHPPQQHTPNPREQLERLSQALQVNICFSSYSVLNSRNLHQFVILLIQLVNC